LQTITEVFYQWRLEATLVRVQHLASGVRFTGAVKTFQEYGFINADGANGRDAGQIFVHYRDLTGGCRGELKPGGRVEFSLGVGQKVGRLQAKKVELLSESEASGEEDAWQQDRGPWGFSRGRGGRLTTVKGRKGMGKSK